MKKITLSVLFILFFSSLVFAQADQLTLTTYYPAPFGMYQEMRVMGKLGVGTTNPANKLDVNGSASIGYTSNVTAPTNGLIVGGSVGIGTTDPFTKFHVFQNQASFFNPSALAAFITSANQPALIAASHYTHNFTMADTKLPANHVGIYAVGNDGTKGNSDGYAGYFAMGKTYFADNVGVGITNPFVPFHVRQEAALFVSPSALGAFETGANQPALIAASRRGHSFTSGDAKLPHDNIGIYALGYDGTKGGGFAGYFAGGKTYFADNVGIGTTNPIAMLEVIGSLKKGLTTATTEEVLVPSDMSVSIYRNTGLCDPSLPSTALTTVASCGALPAQCQLPYGHTCTQITNMGICSAMVGCYQSGPPCQGTPNCGAYTTALACSNAGGGGGFCYWFPGNPGTNNTFVGRMYPTP